MDFGLINFFNFFFFQERLEQIADELRSVSEKTEDLLGSAVQTYKEQADLPALQFQMESLQGRQTQLLLEQSELMKQNHLQPSRYFYTFFLEYSLR